jgi:hypothetical protein
MVNATLRDAGKSQSGEYDLPRATNAYYFVSGRPHSGKSYTIQYWYYWTYNYYPVTRKITVDQHEGDLEHYDVKFDKYDRPVSVLMSRHLGEHKYSWDDEDLERTSSNAILYAAHGDHALYEKCGGFLNDSHFVRDWTCKPGEEITVATPEDVRIDLRNAATGYACWRGLYGEGGHDGGRIKANGPGSFLRQSKVSGKVCG